MPHVVTRDELQQLLQQDVQLVEVLPTNEFEEEHLPERELHRRRGEARRGGDASGAKHLPPVRLGRGDGALPD